MVLEILIATVEEHMDRIAQMLLPEREDVRYLVSCQYGGLIPNQYTAPKTPSELETRSDVRVVFQEGRGLSRNRNNTLLYALGDILMIADDDEVFYNDGLSAILHIYEKYNEVDIALFRLDGISRHYPNEAFSFKMNDFLGSYYTTSGEITLRKSSIGSLRFNEHYGLGSEFLASGEEQVFICDALHRGLHVNWFPVTIARTRPETTGDRFLTDERVQRSKGATLLYLFGNFRALQLCFKEALHYLIFRRINPVRLFMNMYEGIRYARHLYTN